MHAYCRYYDELVNGVPNSCDTASTIRTKLKALVQRAADQGHPRSQYVAIVPRQCQLAMLLYYNCSVGVLCH